MTFCMLAAHCKNALCEEALMPTLTLESGSAYPQNLARTDFRMLYNIQHIM